jgi:amino acid adenylation domain-containing protein
MTPVAHDPAPADQAGLLVDSAGDFAVAMFAAWRAGLGVLPLPVEFPDDRLRHMIEDARPFAVLASPGLRERAGRLAGAVPGIRVLDVHPGEAFAPVPSAPPDDHPAFTVYTSGSTGRPKGVAIRERQVADLLAWEIKTWGLGPWVRMAQTLSLGFDFGLQELFSALPSGGCLIVPQPADRRNAPSYADFLRREAVTVLFTTPSFADELAATRLPLPDLRLVLIGGEVLRWSTVDALERVVGPQCRLVNGYGPTEATVNCLAYDIPRGRREPAATSDVVPVGRASGPATIHLLDGNGRPVPVGAVGQISIGGSGVADGYLNRPDLTAERFVPGPGPDAGVVYRSGDLAYLGSDGNFVVTGRADRQVKLRGYRVEQDEVEQALRQCPAVVAAVVRLVSRPARLVAVVSGPVAVNEVLGDLARRLPAPMIPDHVIVLDELPRTPNGKLDDEAITRLAQSAGEHALPATDVSVAQIEQLVCRVWREELRLAAVDPVRNVFDQGAHSLAATRAHGQLQALLGVSFPVSDLFEFPSPRELAERLRTHRRTTPDPA